MTDTTAQADPTTTTEAADVAGPTTTIDPTTGGDLDTRYRDASLSVDERVEILLSQMTLEEKAGLFFQTMIAMNEDGTLSDGDPVFGLPATDEYVNGRLMSHFNIPPGKPPS